MLTNKLATLMACPLLLLLAGCGSTPAPTVKEAPKPLEPVSGQSALYKMYQVARAAWAGDAQVLTCISVHLPEVPQVQGKAGAWRATFTSASLGRQRSYSYSVVEATDLHKDVFAGPEDSWSGKQGQDTGFTIQAVSIDTNAAYKTALDQGGADYDKKNPGMNVAFMLEKTSKFPDPAWRVIWGESVGTSNFSIYVDASTGVFLAKMH
jgi:hypothetical protein